ncbi:MAG: DUF362 domain-containing protein [Gemmataceae bacterium]|nr:DUF362 domain-containing protein [Gemmataceae bacterium]
MDAVAPIVKELLDLALPEGGWGYTPGQRAHLEPTCLALLALHGRPEAAEVVARGRSARENYRQADGSYRLAGGREEFVWGTSLALVTLIDEGADDARIKKSASFLLGVRGKPGQEDADTDRCFDIDVKLVGWPWAEGTFSWVEPTAWACIALSMAGQGEHPRVRQGLDLLRDRAFDRGGANYGNKIVLSTETEPIPGPSAVLLWAMQGRIQEPRIASAIDYVIHHARHTLDLEHLAQAKIALALHNLHDLGWLDERIIESVAAQAKQTWANRMTARLALAAIALDNGRPFRLTPAVQPPLPEATPTKHTPSLGERIKGGMKRFVVRGLDGLRQPPGRSVVHVAAAPDYDADLISIVKEQYASLRDLVPLAGKRVVLKPNLVEYHRDKVINTDPRVINAVIELCKAEGAREIIVAEGPGHWRNVRFLVEESGLGEVLDRQGVKFVDLNHDEPVKMLNLGGLTGLSHLFIAKTVATNESAEVLISMPKLKTHHWAGATLSLKNLFGTLPGVCYGWPKNELHWRGIAQSIVDIALTNTPHLAIIDGIVGMQGDGPLNGTARPVGALVMSNDLVAADATGCRLMGLHPERIIHVAVAATKRLGRLGPDGVEYRGVPVAQLASEFEKPPRFEKITMPA